jgi:glycine oxidase
MFDVVIAGNGALGLSTARALAVQDPGLRVAVVGPGDRPGGASVAAGAMLGCFGEVTAPLLRTAAGRARIARGERAATMWPSWLDGVNAELGEDERVVIRKGTAIIANAKSGTIEDENLTAIETALRAANEPYEKVDPAGVPGLRPADDCRPHTVLFLPNEGSVDAGRLLRGLELLVERSPHQSLVDGTVRSLSVSSGRVTGVVLTDGRRIQAPQVVLASGVGTQAVLDQLPELAGRVPRLLCGGGTSLVLKATKPTYEYVVRTPNRAFACGLHAVPRAGEQVYVGATNVLSTKPIERSSLADMTFLLDCVLDQLNQDLFAAELVRWQAGNRPVPIDTCPLVGATSVDGLWLQTGTYRDGLFLSPLLAQHVAGGLVGKPGLLDDDCLPERRPISLYTAQDARDEAVRHFLAMGAEHGITLPRVGLHRAMPRFYGSLLDRVYDAMEDDEFVLPPEIGAMASGSPDTLVPFFNRYLADVRRAWP